MALLAPLSNMLCRHEFYWSERHLTDRCRRCGLLRDSDQADANSGDPKPVSNDGSAYEHAGFVDWRRPRMAGSDSETEARPGPSASDIRRQSEDRRRELLKLMQAAASGAELSRLNVLDMAMGLIEDGHSADPQVFGPQAAEYFANLSAARHGT